MPTEIPPGLLDGIGVVGIVVLLGIALGRGWLVTARELRTALHDRDEWRAESRIKDAQLAERDKQIVMLGEVGETVEQLFRSLQERSDR